MMFTEVEFGFFLPVVLLVYWLGPRSRRWQNGVLLLASYVFFCSWNWRFLPLLLSLTLVDYFLAPILDPESGRPPSARRLALALSLIANLGALGYFKYAAFFADSLNSLLIPLGLGTPLPVLRVLLPLGISFFTLQKIGYVVDVYYGRQPACRSLLTFALFTAFFPQLTAGPISRSRELMPQLAVPRLLRPDAVAAGCLAMLLGWIQKGFIAETMSQALATPVFLAPEQFSVAGHWAGLAAYAIQVFCDFAGYSLLAIGSAKLFGVTLPDNFRLPYLSTSILEFWRRWHITLTNWLFDYIYTPLTTGTGFWRGKYTLALLLVFLASGLWHGAALTFVVWGAVHGVGLMVNREWDEYYRSLCRRDRKWVAVRAGAGYRSAAWFITQLFFVLTLILFRSPSLSAAGGFAAGLVHSAGSAFPDVSTFNERFKVLCAAAMFLALHAPAFAAGRRIEERFHRLPGPVRGMAYALLVVFLSLFSPVNAGAFIYRQF